MDKASLSEVSNVSPRINAAGGWPTLHIRWELKAQNLSISSPQPTVLTLPTGWTGRRGSRTSKHLSHLASCRSNFSLQKQGNKIPVTVLCRIQCSSKSFLLRNVHSDNQLSGPLPFTFINLSLECSVVENYN